MTFDELKKGKGKMVVVLCKEKGEYALVDEFDTMDEFAQWCIKFSTEYLATLTEEKVKSITKDKT